MADSEDASQAIDPTQEDVAMAGDDADGDEDAGADDNDEEEEDLAAISSPQNVFLEYLKSPIVRLRIGADIEETTLSAHLAVLAKSPYFAEKLKSASLTNTLLEMPDESLDAMACFLQYQYTGEYFPRRLATSPDGLEKDPSVPEIDDTGDQLLKHARVYTLADKLGLPDLKTLAHSKIHRINSTAVGEIAYARYVYGNTLPEDSTIRKPVAAFWATRSHVLRHEAEKEFKAMCLEFPQFGFDVLSLVLDQREKRAREREEDSTPAGGKGRKRMKPSIGL